MKFLKTMLIVAIVAPMFLVSCGDKKEGGKYSLSFNVPDSVSYSVGLSMGNYLQRSGIQSVDLDEFEKGMKKGLNIGDDKSELDSAKMQVQTLQMTHAQEQQTKMQADTNYVPAPLDFPKEESYGMGLMLGDNLVSSNLDKSNLGKIMEGIKDQLGNSAKYTPEVSSRMMQSYFTLNDSLRIQVNEQYLADNKEKEGVITTPSGLQYRVIKEGEGEKPVATDQVKVNYKGTFVDGKTFDSSYDRGEPITFPLSGVIPGWTEGVALMSPGSKYELVLPYDIAYGERGNQNIPPKSTLVFEIELLEVVPPAPQPQIPADAQVAPKEGEAVESEKK